MTAKGTPDGHTLLFVAIGHAINPLLQKNLPYDTQKDFTPVSLAAILPLIVTVHPTVPANNVKELIALAKTRRLNYASGGVGSSQHLATALFASMAKIDLVHIPYKGNVPAISDLVGGQTSMLFATLPTVLPLAKAGKLHALAVTGAQRNPTVPDVPTMADTLPGFEVTNWIALFAPAGTPGDIVAKLNAEIMRIMRLPDVQSRLVNEGAKFTPNTPSEFAAFVKAEITKWGKVIKDSGARVD
jgi:tripartite-type tricarboxylate transporter receptor subunit TctC